MIYEKNNFKINSDFKLKEIQKDKYNVDLIIDVEYRCVNIYFNNFTKLVNYRVQFPLVKSILVRFCNVNENNICTIHLLSDSGIYSSMANFEIDYSKIYLEVCRKDFFVSLTMNDEEDN
ncbi:hypothetical protein KPL37_03720 [Clostridium frigoris]|uniref:Uncharacterized protein n=1 Tax=Clostridium frigoris TaxID=205327 RepID=A0ABS6BPN2_9CLOT|nr:hypothetical protein [Clostridium frigoris]MBU3158873.1 hypothetical protein [Clostridium frigoris]